LRIALLVKLLHGGLVSTGRGCPGEWTESLKGVTRFYHFLPVRKLSKPSYGGEIGSLYRVYLSAQKENGTRKLEFPKYKHNSILC
jgi:hypothetical protein